MSGDFAPFGVFQHRCFSRSGQTDRRRFLKTIGATAVLSVAGGRVGHAGANDEHGSSGVSVEEAKARLIAGNERFVTGNTHGVHTNAQLLAQLEKGQHPFATILGCSDSRVPIELIFDQGLGDLFVIRLAGNVVDADVEGSIEYAFAHLQTRLLVVLGHEGCGAVTAALAAKDLQEKEPAGIQLLLKQIAPALDGLDASLPMEKRLHLAVEANVRQSVKQILTFPGHQAAHDRGDLEVVGAIYDMHTGKVRFLDPS